MTSDRETFDRETTRVVRDWLDEGDTRLPDRVLDAVLDWVPANPQRRRGPFGLAFAGPLVPIGLAAAAVVVIALIGLNLVVGPNVGAPDPSAAPTPTTDPMSRLQFWTGRELPPGEYVIDDPFPARIRITVPSGWHAFGATETLAGICTNACEQPDRVALAFWIVTNVYADPCDRAGLADPPIGESVDDLVAALVDLPRREATAPRAESIRGYPATYLELTADGTLGDCALPGFRAWTAGTEFRESPPGERDRLWILDVDGTRLMVDIAWPPNASAEDVAELETVIESLRIEPLDPAP